MKKKHLAFKSKDNRWACNHTRGKDGLSEKELLSVPEKDRCLNCNYKLSIRFRRRNGEDLSSGSHKNVWPAEFTKMVN